MKRRSKLLVKLAYYTHKLIDPYSKGHFTTIEVFVPKPTIENPLPCLLVAIRNGHQRLFFRVQTLRDLHGAFGIPRGAKTRLEMALIEANHEADRLEQDSRLLFAKRHLAEGGRIVRTDTGEIIAEAERIIRERLR